MEQEVRLLLCNSSIYLIYSLALKIEVTCFSVTSVNFQPTKRCYMRVLEDRTGHSDHREFLKAETSQSVKATCCIIDLARSRVYSPQNTT
jgi:hypothetical protein